MSRDRAVQQRQPKALAVDDEPSYMTEFRQAMLARGLATRTRNAYVRDLRSCELTNPVALTRWQPDDVLHCLSPRSRRQNPTYSSAYALKPAPVLSMDDRQ